MLYLKKLPPPQPKTPVETAKEQLVETQFALLSAKSRLELRQSSLQNAAISAVMLQAREARLREDIARLEKDEPHGDSVWPEC